MWPLALPTGVNIGFQSGHTSICIWWDLPFVGQINFSKTHHKLLSDLFLIFQYYRSWHFPVWMLYFVVSECCWSAEKARPAFTHRFQFGPVFSTLIALVECFIVLLAQAILCHEEPAWASKAPCLLLAGSLWHKDRWLSVTERIYNRSPIK